MSVDMGKTSQLQQRNTGFHDPNLGAAFARMATRNEIEFKTSIDMLQQIRSDYSNSTQEVDTATVTGFSRCARCL